MGHLTTMIVYSKYFHFRKRKGIKMDYIKMICLYLKKYISDEQFENCFFDNLNGFENCLENDIYINVLSADFNSKEERINIQTELREYVLKNYKSIYENINDAYVERILDDDKEDIAVKILRENNRKREVVDIDCNMINTQLELIRAIKQALQYPQFSGNTWDAIEDLAYDIVFPQKLIFHNWNGMEKKLSQDTYILKSILDRNNYGRCIIVYD